MPALVSTTTELLTTPATGNQFGLFKLAVLSRMKPVVAVSQEIVRVFPATLLVVVNVGNVAVGWPPGMPVA